GKGFPPLVGGCPICCLLYADHILIFDLTPKDLQNHLQRLSKYSDSHYLKINVSKSKVLCLLGKKKMTFPNYRWILGNQNLEIVKSYPFLGKILSGNLSDVAHIASNKAKTEGQARGLG
ncbi:hypothetical protein NDU88_003517, partial [Pleurodeles waltl]